MNIKTSRQLEIKTLVSVAFNGYYGTYFPDFYGLKAEKIRLNVDTSVLVPHSAVFRRDAN